MNNQNNQAGGNGQKKAKSDFVVACNGVKLAIKGKLARAHVVSTFDYQNKGFPKYSTYLIVDPSDPKLQQLANACRQIKQQFFPNMPDLLWSSPIKDARTPFRPDGSEWQDWQKGNVFIAVSTGADYPPATLVKDAHSPKGYREATVLDKSPFFYDGADAVVEFAAGGMEGNNKGINLFFNGILGLGTGERFVIASSGSFNADEAFADFLKGTAGGADTGSTLTGNHGQNNNFNQNNGQNNNYQNNQGNGHNQYQNSNSGNSNGYDNSNVNGTSNQNNNSYQNHNYNGNGQNMGNGQQNGTNQNGSPTTYHSNGQNNNQNWNNNGNGGGSLV